MRFLLTTLLGSSLLAALPSITQAAPADYHPPRHYYTPSHQPYQRLPLRLSFGFNLASYNGDITGRTKDNTLRLGLSVGLIKTLSPHLTFGLDLGYVKFEAVDQYPYRGLRFASTNGLLTTFLRYNILADKSMYIGPQHRAVTWQPFLQAGIGGLVYDPATSVAINGRYVALPPEGNNTYPNLAGVLPVGGGITVRAGQHFHFTLEGLYYFTTTDMLDGVSQRGNPDSVDSFITGALKIEYALHKGKGKPLVHFD